MGYLTFFMHILIGSVLAGTFVMVALILNMVDARTIAIAAIVGYVVAIPLAWVVAKAIRKNTV